MWKTTFNKLIINFNKLSFIGTNSFGKQMKRELI